MEPLDLLLLRFIPADLGFSDVAALTAYLQVQVDTAQAFRPVLLAAGRYQMALALSLSQAMVVLMRQPDSKRLGDTQVSRDMGVRLQALRAERRAAYQLLGLPAPGDPNLASTSMSVVGTFGGDPSRRGPW